MTVPCVLISYFSRGGAAVPFFVFTVCRVLSMADFCELWQGGPRFAQAEHFKLGTDCVLLADFVNTASARRGIDLGCASGAISLLLLARSLRRCTAMSAQ